MRSARIVGRLKALSPVFHGGNEKTGNVVLLNRLKFVVGDEVVDVPIINGNAVRGRLRRLVMRDLLEQIGFELDLGDKRHQKLYHTLFAGGVLTAAESESEVGAIDLSFKSRLVKIPPIALFGLSYSNQMIEGRLKVGHLLPICKELEEYTGVKSNISFYQLITRAFQTRRDELRGGERGEEDEEDEGEETVQMIVEYEAFAAGTEFYHEMFVEGANDLLLSALARAVELFKQSPYIGGKSAVGFGKLKIEYDLDATPDLYLKYLDEHAGEIKETLQELMKRL